MSHESTVNNITTNETTKAESQKSAGQHSGLASRRLACRWLHEVLVDHKSLVDILAGSENEPAFQALTPRDRAFARAITMTSLRYKKQIDAILNNYLSKKLPAKNGVGEILLSSAAQLLFLNTPPHAAIDVAVRLAKKRPATRPFSGLVNAVLRKIAREGKEFVKDQDELMNLPQWMRQRWANHYGASEGDKIARAQLQEAGLDFTINNSAGEVRDWAEKLEATPLIGRSIRLGVNRYKRGGITDLEGFAEGAWWVQDVAATIPAALFGDVENKKVADLCAAPGGKTLQLAASGAHVTAVDISPKRLQRLGDNLKRVQLNADIVAADILDWAGDEANQQQYDAVLLDAPCSATGTMRRHPDMIYLKTDNQIHQLAQLQSSILSKMHKVLKAGGLLIYCTCSLEPEEGEDQIDRLLATNSDFTRDRISAGEFGGHDHWITSKGDVRTLPHYTLPQQDSFPGKPEIGMDGFFISRLSYCP